MTIKVGDKLPEGELQEFVEAETAGCSLGPNTFKVAGHHKRQEDRDLRLAWRIHADLFGQARARLCAAVRCAEKQRVDEVWCLSVNDPFVMGAWGRDQNTAARSA